MVVGDVGLVPVTEEKLPLVTFPSHLAYCHVIENEIQLPEWTDGAVIRAGPLHGEMPPAHPVKATISDQPVAREPQRHVWCAALARSSVLMANRLALDAPGLAVNACIPSFQDTRSNRMYHPLLLDNETDRHLPVSSTPSSSSQSNSEVLDTLQEILRRLPPATESRPEVQAASSVATNSHAFTAMGHVFEWPIFAINKSTNGVAFDVLGTSQMQEINCGASPAFGMPRLDGEEISALLTRFLRMVHIMNPILDCTTLMKYGRTIAELGPQWDSQTCLVVSQHSPLSGQAAYCYCTCP